MVRSKELFKIVNTTTSSGTLFKLSVSRGLSSENTGFAKPDPSLAGLFWQEPEPTFVILDVCSPKLGF